MTKINSNFLKLKAGYLFPEIGRRVNAYAKAHPEAKLIRMGIGDVVLPLAPAMLSAFHQGVDEMADVNTFKGYGPEQGYEFLRQAIATHDFQARGADISADEIFVSDGSKCDTGNIQEIFASDSRVAVSDPVYPVYVDTNVMAGRTGESDNTGRYDHLVYMRCDEANEFSPQPPLEDVDLIYLCSPNNPTGSVLDHAALEAWVAYAKAKKAIILYDAAYEAFISDERLPHSIYEVKGAKDVAIEFRSFSKNAGFTGVRCAYTVVPKGLSAFSDTGHEVSLHSLWNRRHCTKFNGVSYPVQKAAMAAYSDEGKAQIREMVGYYMENARLIAEALQAQGRKVYGGKNAPYIWVKTPSQLGSWEYFDLLLNEVQVVGTPGAGFGSAGEGYFRFSAFAKRESVLEAIERLKKLPS